MEHSLNLERSRSAVLSMDLQAGIVGIYTKSDRALTERAGRVLKAARDGRVAVIHVQVGFRPGLPEVSSRNALFSGIKNSVQHQQLFRGPLSAIHPAVAPEADEVVITKHRVSGFTGTDLEIVLRANEIDTLILMGIATSGVVLSTLLDASDRDYRLLVVKDCCIDLNVEVHECLLAKIFPAYATVTMSEQLINVLATG